MLRVIALILFMVASPLQAGEVSEYHQIDRIQVNASGTVYVVGTGDGWGAPSCPNATYAYYSKSENTASTEFMTLVVAAKSTGVSVRFDGICSSSNYFKVHYIIYR